MKLTGKIILIYMFAMVLLTTLHGYSVVRREDEQLREGIAEQARSIGVAMERELIVSWQQGGHDGIARVIRQADNQHQQMSIRWVALKTGQAESTIATSIERLKMADRGRVLSFVSHDRQRMYYPIDVANQRAGCLEFSQPLTDVDRYTRGTVYRTSRLVLGMLLCGGVVTLLGLRLVGRRLDKLIEKTQRIGRSDFSEPLQLRGDDELNQLARALNEMSQQLAEQQKKIRSESTARLAAVEQLRHVDRLNTVGRLASGLAHELGTPLNVVSGRAELIASGRLDAEQTCESAVAIKSEADRMANIIRELLDFARRRTPQRKSVSLRPLAEGCADLLRALAKKHNVKIVVTGNDALTANVDAAQMQQVLANLVVNAIQAMPGGGMVSIDVQRRLAKPPNATERDQQMVCCVSIGDEGVGISEEYLPHLFEPFFTTKDVGEGTGLGLSVSYGIVQDHEGWIDVQSEPGRGSCFTVFLPSS